MQDTWILDEMVLARDVLVLPAGGGRELVIRREGGLAPGLSVSPGLLSLVDDFRTPRRIVDAVWEYSEERDLDPEETLDEAFPVFQRLLAAGLLRRLGSSAGPEPAGSDDTDGTDDSAGMSRVVSPRHFVHDLLRTVRAKPDEVLAGRAQAPVSSLAFGAAGIAYGLYRMSRVWRRRELLDLAARWMRHAWDHRHAEEAFLAAKLGLNEPTVGHVNPYHTATGVQAVRALIADARGDGAGRDEALRELFVAARRPCDTIDLYLGEAGVVLAAAILTAALRPRPPVGLLELGREKAARLWSRLTALRPIADDRLVRFLGIAHGWGGLLFALLAWTRASGDPVPAALEERLSQLAALGERRGRSLRWPRIHGSRAEPIYLPTWCNGAAGLVHLWVLAYRVYGKERYLELARRSAWNAWEEGEPSLGDLCCGFAGRAYALLSFYKSSGDDVWLKRARRLAVAAVRVSGTDHGLTHSLYKGRLGPAVLVTELARPESAAMPFFELDDAP